MDARRADRHDALAGGQEPAESPAGAVADDGAVAEAVAAEPRSTTTPWTRLVHWVVPPGNDLAQPIYGLITAGALLAAESSTDDTLWQIAGAVAVVLLLYWLGHAYAATLGQRLEERAQLSARHLLHRFRHSWTVVRGGYVPLAVLLLAAAAGAGTIDAVVAALASAAALLAVLEVVAAVRAGLRRRRLALQLAIGITLGVGIFLLRIILK